MTLDELEKNKIAIILDITASGLLLQKLYDMGFIHGTRVELIRASPLNDPIEIQILSYKITLRREEARAIKVKYE